MDDYEREQALMFFGGTLPPGFEYEFTRKKRFLHSEGFGGRLKGLPLMELYWDYRDFWPGEEVRVAPVVQEQAPAKEELLVHEKVTWDTITEGQRVAAYFQDQLHYGIYEGMSGDRVKVSFQGDEKNYRLLSKDDVDINGRE